MLEMLPDNEQVLAEKVIKRIVLAWDPDFTNVTKEERQRIDMAEASGYIPAEVIDCNNLDQYLND
ncbi:MAG: hypothetical protein FWF08_07765 [Oscillospiraceae bacterium]|nr:hypothetical protein [Oscillospiraceae bacterium]